MNINNLSSVILSAAVALQLSSCAGKMSKQDCDPTKIYSLGENDGEHGKPADGFKDSMKQCNDQGVLGTDDKYRQGRTVGLAKYCSDDRAKSDAEDGKKDSICQQESFPPYVSAYQQKLTELKEAREKAVQDLQSQKSKAQKQEGTLQNKIDDINNTQQN